MKVAPGVLCMGEVPSDIYIKITLSSDIRASDYEFPILKPDVSSCISCSPRKRGGTLSGVGLSFFLPKIIGTDLANVNTKFFILHFRHPLHVVGGR